jgi:hypothetical protein
MVEFQISEGMSETNHLHKKKEDDFLMFMEQEGQASVDAWG